MSAADGIVVGTTKIVDNGDAAKRFNIVLVAEGYTNAQLGQFATDAQKFVDELFSTAPFNDLKCAINVYRIDVSSTDSGADDPAACGGTGATPATYFDASFCNSGIRRLLLVNNTTVLNVVNAQVPQWHSVLVVVNSSVWGGAGGSIGTTSTAPGWEKIPIHEMGHAVFGFADEYEYWASCAEVGHDNYAGAEPAQPNVTANADRATIKWSSLILPATPMPTTDNADCGNCDPQPNPVASSQHASPFASGTPQLPGSRRPGQPAEQYLRSIQRSVCPEVLTSPRGKEWRHNSCICHKHIQRRSGGMV